MLDKYEGQFGDGVLVTFVRDEGVNEGINLLYQTIRQKPGLRIPELSTYLNVPAKTLERWIKQLRQEKRIIFKGSAKKGGYYTANEDVNS